MRLEADDGRRSLSDAAHLERVRRCLARLGTPGFHDAFFGPLAGPLRIAQCMVFRYREDGVDCLLSRNFSSVARGRSIAQRYLERGFRLDPLRARLDALGPDEAEVYWGEECRAGMDTAYRREFFDEVGVGDKVAVLNRSGGMQVCVNFYGSPERAPFDAPDEPARAVWSLLAQTYLTHVLLDPGVHGLGPLAVLSEKERQVCAGILRGRKIEQIAADCRIAASTAVTYRRRAYEKLGISSRGALFAICGGGR
jgi:DNA-binding CsgD family transcriptional regulator